MTGAPVRSSSIGRRAAPAALTLLTLLALMPPALFLAARSVADALGCQLDEGAAQACLVGARDIGDVLHADLVLGAWLSLRGAPVLLITSAVWSWIAIRRLRSS